MCSIAQVLSLMDTVKTQPGKALSRTSQYKRLSKDLNTQTTAKVLQAVRALAVTWMQANGDYSVWEGMPLRTLTMHMAWDTSLSYGQHLVSMGTDKEWIDATMLNALGCVFSVDVAVWQDGVDPLLVGHSTGPADRSGEPALDLIHVAMVNDLHFWGVKRIDVNCTPTVDLTLEHGDWIRLPQVEERKTSKAHGGDAGSAVATGAALQLSHNHMTDAEVDAELKLCTTLVEWGKTPLANKTTRKQNDSQKNDSQNTRLATNNDSQKPDSQTKTIRKTRFATKTIRKQKDSQQNRLANPDSQNPTRENPTRNNPDSQKNDSRNEPTRNKQNDSRTNDSQHPTRNKLMRKIGIGILARRARIFIPKFRRHILRLIVA